MMGDSTTRQWFEFLEKKVPGKLISDINGFDLGVETFLSLFKKTLPCYLRLDSMNA